MLPKRRNKKLAAIIIAMAAVFLIAAIGIGAWQITGRIQLKEDLMRDWSSTESKDGVYYKRVLDFSEDEIKYKFKSSMLDSTMATYSYKVVSPHKIKVYWSSGPTEIVMIEFDEGKQIMQMTPALTQSASHEFWYDFD